MSKIIKIHQRMIIDSRGAPTTEVEVTTADGTFRAACPSGASTGIYEALELRDDDKKNYFGKGVSKALDNIKNVITPALLGMDVCNQEAIDAKMQELDGTANKTFGKLGANAVLPVSMACCVAAAAHNKMPLWKWIAKISGTEKCCLPVPCMNIINGGKHAGNQLAPQEYMVASIAATTMVEAMKQGMEVYNELKKILKGRFGIGAIAIGDEGGFAPPVNNCEEPLECIMEAIKNAGLEGKMGICMDVAASEFYVEDKKMYDLKFKNGNDEHQYISGKDLAAMYVSWAEKYPIVSIEDPFDQDDFESYAHLLATIQSKGLKTQVVGDDLTVSQVSRVQMAIDKKACNALLLKVNQVGTVMGAIHAAKLAMKNDWHVMVSHRSGETEDCFIAHLVVGLATEQIKTGAPTRSERTCKYNELMRIEECGQLPYGCGIWK
ncbi:Enolase [Spironucleus salmonicida]|uniref:phosphopyruvate hydratase n=1 Tax=Spironucleus salmonicida TaxID=348837 RepID=V6LEX0_9EUKA|nr:Enolase [Spironucleus salmonicida]|eukprot:EST42221.1 Enolase [Spironucleus salmonicida]